MNVRYDEDDEVCSLLEGNKCCQKNKRMLLCHAKDEKDRHPCFFLRRRTERTGCGGAINSLGRCRVRRSSKRLLFQLAERPETRESSYRATHNQQWRTWVVVVSLLLGASRLQDG